MSVLLKEGDIKISGVMLMYIADVLRERQLAIFSSMADMMQAGDEEKVERLGAMAMANQAAGQKILDCIEKLLGKETLDKFIDGNVEVDISSVAPSSQTVN